MFEFVLKISKFPHFSQNHNSSISCLLRRGMEPGGNSYIIEIALLCHKQRCIRTDVNGIKILKSIFLTSHIFLSILMSVTYLLWERKGGEKYRNKYWLLRKSFPTVCLYWKNPKNSSSGVPFFWIRNITFAVLNFSNKNLLLST